MDTRLVRQPHERASFERTLVKASVRYPGNRLNPGFALLERVIDPTLRLELARRIAAGWFSSSGYLSLREDFRLSRTEILVFLVKYGDLAGCTSSQTLVDCIGRKLGMSGNTVRTHVTRILRKLGFPGCRDAGQVKNWAVENRVFEDPALYSL